MSSVYIDEHVNNLLRSVLKNDSKYVIFTRLSSADKQTLQLGLCDGYDVNIKEIDVELLDELVNHVDCGGRKNFFTILRSSFSNAEITVSQVSENYLITYGTGSSSFTLKLLPTTSSQRKEMFHYLFFELATKLQSCSDELQDLKTEINVLQNREKQGDVGSSVQNDSFYEPMTKRAKPMKMRPKKGISLINPGTRKKAAASGVVFDDE